MNETRKTATIAGVAIVLALLAWVTAPRKVTPNNFQDRGTSFFPGFNDPTQARSLEVVEFDAETATAHPFKVQVENGLWIIPSHFNYPADGDQRLSNTAAAIIAMKKDNVATENVSEHERTGTLDPLDETLPTIQGRGTRVTFKGENDRMLADVIIGKPVEGRPTFRYVRLADQSRVWVADVGDLDLSTKFADWIDRDLLQIKWADVDQVIVRDYSLDKATRGVNLRDTLFIQKTQEEPPDWTMRDIKADEHVDNFRANLLVTTLDELTIIGVRPKPTTIVAGLAQLTGSLKISQEDLAELGSKGFHFTPKGQLLADEGEVLVHTKSGIFFSLRFGDIAYGDPEGVVSGPTDPKTGKPLASAPQAAVPAAAVGKTAAPADDKGVGVKPVKPAASKAAPASPNHYLVITASFDPTAIPAGPERDAAQQRAAALQRRFAPWYYVVPGEAFDRMKLSRSVLIKPGKHKAPEA